LGADALHADLAALGQLVDGFPRGVRGLARPRPQLLPRQCARQLAQGLHGQVVHPDPGPHWGADQVELGIEGFGSLGAGIAHVGLVGSVIDISRSPFSR
jgi:hypothetical protein